MDYQEPLLQFFVKRSQQRNSAPIFLISFILPLVLNVPLRHHLQRPVAMPLIVLLLV